VHLHPAIHVARLDLRRLIPRLRDIARFHCSARLRLAGDIDRCHARMSMSMLAEHEHDARQRARRYWQLADSDDALSPHDALSTRGAAPSDGAK